MLNLIIHDVNTNDDRSTSLLHGGGRCRSLQRMNVLRARKRSVFVFDVLQYVNYLVQHTRENMETRDRWNKTVEEIDDITYRRATHHQLHLGGLASRAQVVASLRERHRGTSDRVNNIGGVSHASASLPN